MRFVTRAVPWWRRACLRPSHRCHPICRSTDRWPASPSSLTQRGAGSRSGRRRNSRNSPIADFRSYASRTSSRSWSRGVGQHRHRPCSAEPATPAPSAVASKLVHVIAVRPLRARVCSRRVCVHTCLPAGGDHRGRPHGRHGYQRADTVQWWPTHLVTGRWLDRKDELLYVAACSTTIVRPDGSDRRELATWDVPVRPDWQELQSPPVWSRDDRVLAMPGPDGSLLVGNGDGSELRAIGTFPIPGGWSADGSTFVFVRDGDAWLAQADGSGVRNLTEFPFGGAAYAAWSPDGRWINGGARLHHLGLFARWGPSASVWVREWRTSRLPGRTSGRGSRSRTMTMSPSPCIRVDDRQHARCVWRMREKPALVTRRPAPGGLRGRRGGRHEPRWLGPRNRPCVRERFGHSLAADVVALMAHQPKSTCWP